MSEFNENASFRYYFYLHEEDGDIFYNACRIRMCM